MSGDEDRLAKLHGTLVARVEGLVSGEEWTRFLVESSRFTRYSANNRMLIAAQLAERGIEPEGLAASYKTWQRVPAVGGGTCQVRRGEQALWIYAPLTVTRRQTDETTGQDRSVAVGVRGFKAVPVFHHSQLAQPPDLVEPPPPELLRGEQAPARVWDGIVAELASAGYTVDIVERDPGAGWNGRTNFADRSVEVHADLEAPQRLKTLAHEWAHVTLDHGAAGAPARHVAEVEAESVAYLVMATVDIDASGYTIPYVSGWSAGSTETVKATVERVIGTAASLVARLETRLGIDLTPDLLSAKPQPDIARQPDVAIPSPAPSAVLADRLELSDRLTRPDHAELAERPAPERLAFLLAAAGVDAAQAVETFRELGVSDTVTATALTAIHPYSDAVGLPAEPLYNPTEVRAATQASEPAGQVPLSGAGGYGLSLIREWDALETSRTQPAQLELDLGQPGRPR